MTKLNRAEVERLVRAYWKTQAEPRDVRTALPSARALGKLGTDWLRSTGFDLRKARALREQHHAEWDRSARRAAAAAARRWAANTRRTQAAAAAWAGNMMATAAGAPADNAFFLAKPISIVASDPKTLKDTHFEKGNSFAKVLVDRESSDVDTVSFIFGFRNAGASTFRFDFDTLLNVSGHVRVRAGAGFANVTEAIVDAKLDVLTISQVTDVRNVATVPVISDGPPFFLGETNERTFSQTRFLTAPGIAVESDDIAVLLVSLVVKSSIDDGRVVADFNAGSFRVQCPAVFIARQALPLKLGGVIPAGVAEL